MSTTPDELIGIGEFARRVRLTVKQLRSYDELGLLRPAHVDPDTGYRHYHRGQARTAVTIALLRSLDVPLADVHDLLVAGPDDAHALLDRQRARLEAQVERGRRALDALDRTCWRPRAAALRRRRARRAGAHAGGLAGHAPRRSSTARPRPIADLGAASAPEWGRRPGRRPLPARSRGRDRLLRRRPPRQAAGHPRAASAAAARVAVTTHAGAYDGAPARLLPAHRARRRSAACGPRAEVREIYLGRADRGAAAVHEQEPHDRHRPLSRADHRPASPRPRASTPSCSTSTPPSTPSGSSQLILPRRDRGADRLRRPRPRLDPPRVPRATGSRRSSPSRWTTSTPSTRGRRRPGCRSS